MPTKRQIAIRRRRIFLAALAALLVAAIAAVTFTVILIKNAIDGNGSSTDTSKSVSEVSSLPSSDEQITSSETSSEVSSLPSFNDQAASSQNNSTVAPPNLDANYSRLLLVNGEYPLPDNYDYEGNLTTIEDKYINGSLKQIDKDIWPYMKAMLDAARADGVNLAVWSPYRSYATQQWLFNNQVERCKARGFTGSAAEDEAATVVARPGTSEHNTGLAADFNMASDRFAQTEMFTWMKAHAAEYGFILRYPENKKDVTGVIYESWHWRFVGINAAAEINSLGLTLEEYITYKGLDPQGELKASTAQ